MRSLDSSDRRSGKRALSQAKRDSPLRFDRTTRMKVVALVVLLSAAAAGIAAAPGAHSLRPAPADVYLGVACNASGRNCGRVGVAVWLPRTADQVAARLLGSSVALATAHSGSGRYGFRRYWTGFHRFPTMRVDPGSPVRVRSTVVLGGVGRSYVRSVYLSAGWG